jgi:hypothetical protein
MRSRIAATMLACMGVASTAKADWSAIAKVDLLNIGGNGLHGTFVGLVGYSFSGCSTNSIALLEGSNPNYKELISSLLAAKIADRDVQLQYVGCNAGYPVVKELLLR